MARNKLRSRRHTHRYRSVILVLVAITTVLAGIGVYRHNTATSAQDHLTKANLYFARQQPKAAVIELKNALQADPDYLDARWLLVQVYLDIGDGVSASKEIDAAKALGKNDAALERAVLKSLLLQHKYTKVLGHLVTQSDQSVDAELHLIRAQAHLGIGEHAKAKNGFESVIALEPENVHARRGLSASALSMDETEEADRHLTIALAGASEDVESWVLKGELEVSRGALDKAKLAYQEALTRAPQHLLARIGITRVLLLNNEPDAALEHISFLQDANPNNPVSNYLLALASRQKNDAPATKQALLAVLQVSPNHPASLLLMGSLHYSSNELEQARELLSRYVNIQPDDLRGAKLLGAVLLKQKSYALALETLEGALPLAPNDAQLMALLGTVNMAQRQFDKAHAFMQKAAELQPTAAAIRTQLAVSHLFTGDTDKGVAELEAAVELDPEFSRADYLLIILHLREQRFEDALQTATRLQKNQPDNPIPINLSGAAHEGLGDTTAARADYERAIALQPSYATAQLNLARLDIADANLESAEQRFRAVLENNANNLYALSSLAQIADAGGDRSEAVRLLEQARNAHPTAHAPRLVLARYYLSVGNSLAAVQAATEAQTLAPRDAATLLLVGQTNVAVGQHKAAENALRQLVELVPDNAQYQYFHGVALANTGDRAASRAAFERCLALNSDYVAARAALGRLSLSEGNIDAAIEVAGKLQQSFPNDAEGFLLQADALLSAKQLEDAEAAYHLAQAHRPERTTIMKISAVQRALGTPDRAISTFADWLIERPDDQVVRVALASLHQSNGNNEEASKLYEQAIDAEPTNGIALNNLAWIYHERSDPRALSIAKQAYELLPERAEIIDTYAWFLIESGRAEQGLQLLDRALASAPDNADIRYHRAAGLARAGDKLQARSELEAILATGQTFSLRESAETLLGQLQ